MTALGGVGSEGIWGGAREICPAGTSDSSSGFRVRAAIALRRNVFSDGGGGIQRRRNLVLGKKANLAYFLAGYGQD